MNSVKSFCAACCTLLLFACTQLNAQTFHKGQQDIHLGIGLLSTFYGSGYHSVLPPINASYEQGITENIGVGGYLGYATSRWDYNGYDNFNYSWRYSYVIVGARGAYHYDFFKNPKLDTYGGLMLGLTFAKARFHSDDPQLNENDYQSPSAGGFTWSGFVGARYQFREKLGAYAEIGYGVSVLNIGVRLKI